MAAGTFFVAFAVVVLGSLLLLLFTRERHVVPVQSEPVRVRPRERLVFIVGATADGKTLIVESLKRHVGSSLDITDTDSSEPTTKQGERTSSGDLPAPTQVGGKDEDREGYSYQRGGTMFVVQPMAGEEIFVDGRLSSKKLVEKYAGPGRQFVGTVNPATHSAPLLVCGICDLAVALQGDTLALPLDAALAAAHEALVGGLPQFGDAFDAELSKLMARTQGRLTLRRHLHPGEGTVRHEVVVDCKSVRTRLLEMLADYAEMKVDTYRERHDVLRRVLRAVPDSLLALTHYDLLRQCPSIAPDEIAKFGADFAGIELAAEFRILCERSISMRLEPSASGKVVRRIRRVVPDMGRALDIALHRAAIAAAREPVAA